MKRIFLILVLLLAVLFCNGCSKNYDLEAIASEFDIYIDNYITENLQSIEAITVAHASSDFEHVVAYVSEDESGLVIFKYDKQKEKITDHRVTSNENKQKPAFYTGISGNEGSYIGVFISDDDIWSSTTTIEIALENSSEDDINVLNQKTYGNKAVIFKYGKSGDSLGVDKFKLLDLKGEVLYTN